MNTDPNYRMLEVGETIQEGDEFFHRPTWKPAFSVGGTMGRGDVGQFRRKLKFSVTDEAAKLVTGARRDSYGHPFDNFSDTGKMWEVILKTSVTPEQVALCMVAVKICREVHKHKDDNIVDGIGYFQCLQEVIKRREEMGK